MAAPYHFNVTGGSVEFGGTTYGPGDTFETLDPCEMLAFYAAAAEQNPGLRVREEWSGVLEALRNACAAGGGAPAEAPEGEHDEAVPDPSTTGADEAPPGGSETPETIGAPDVGQSGEMGAEGPPDELPAPRQYFHPVDPASDYDLEDRLAAEGAAPDDIEEQVAQARFGESPGEEHPFRSADEESRPTTAGDPVDLFSGEFFLPKVDLEIPSRGFPFRLVRLYRSGRPYFGPLGFNWDHSYNSCLRLLGGGRVAIRSGQMHEDVYTPLPEGGFAPPRKVYAVLEAGADFAASGAYTLTHRGGMRWVFERPPGWLEAARIPLARIEDPNGNAMALSYDAGGRLQRVVDTVGREVFFEYNACGLLSAVVDFTGRRVRYEYDEDALHLTGAATPSTKDHPDGLVTCYEYDRYQPHPALQHNITRIVDPAGQTVVENTYGSDPGGDGFGRVLRQWYLGEEFTYAYTRLGYVPPEDAAINDAFLRVEVQGSCSPYEVHTFNFRGNLLDRRFRLCTDGSFRLWATTCRYNSTGEVIEVRQPNGLGLKLTYDEENDDPAGRGNLLEIALAAPPTSLLPDRVVASFTYEPRHQAVKTATDERGLVTTFVHDYEEDSAGDGAGNLVRVEHPDVTLPDGSVQSAYQQWEYDSYGALVRHTSAAGAVTEYRYYDAGDGTGYLRQEIRDPAGVPLMTSFEYDRWGNVARITDGLGAATQYEWDELGRLRRIVLPAVDGRSAEHLLDYNADGLLSLERVPRGSYADDTLAGEWIENKHTYDCGGRLVETVQGANTASPRVWTYERDTAGRIVGMTDPLGRESEFSFDERGLVLRVVAGAHTSQPLTWKYHYDRNGNLDVVTDPAGREVRLGYDAWDRLTEQTWPANAGDAATTASARYGERDEIVETRVEGPSGSGGARAELGFETASFDERGRPWLRTVGGISSQMWFDADDRVTAQVDPRGNRSNLAYDGRGLLSRITDPAGNQLRYEYDAAGNAVALELTEIDALDAPKSRRYEFEYDARRRAVRATDPLGNSVQTSYDDRDLPVSRADPLGRIVDVEHDLSGAPVRVSTRVGGTRIEQTWSRDLLGRLIGFTDATGRTTQFELSPHGQLLRTTFADGTSHERTYDAAGQLVAETTPGGTRVSTTYDSAGREALVSFVPGPGVLATGSLAFQYDGLGRPTRITSGAGLLERSYDAFGRLVREWHDGREVNAIYDDLNGLVDFVFPDGRRDRATLDPLGRVASIRLLARGAADLLGPVAEGTTLVEYGYLGPNRPRTRRLANGTEAEYGYDGAGRLTSIAHRAASGGIVASTQYLHDAGALRRLAYDTPAPGTAVLHEYDELQRLVAAHHGVSTAAPPAAPTQPEADATLQGIDPATAASSRTFVLDGAEDRLRWTVSDGAAVESFDATYDALHRLTELVRSTGSGTEVIAPSYDGNGNLSGDDLFTYHYDALDQLVEVRRKADGGLVVAFEYDALGRLARREWESGATELFSHSGMRSVERRDGATGATVEQTVFGAGPDELVVQSGPEGNLWAHLDGRRSLVATTDDAGAVLERFSYSPFGEPGVWRPDGVTAVDPAAARPAPVFGGLPFITALGLYDARARVYDPRLGRFLQRDPAGYRDSASPYAYAAHDPVNLVDTTGSYIETAWDALSLGIGLASAYNDWNEEAYFFFALDLVGIVADAAALALPVPGGVGAAIKGVRAGARAADVLSDAVRAYRGYQLSSKVRWLQAAAQAGDVIQGAYHAQQSFAQGSYGWGLVFTGLSALGVRGTLGKASQALWERPRDVVYSVQGAYESIRKSGRIWGETEGSVYGMPVYDAGWCRTGLPWLPPPDERAMYVFVDQATEVFKPHGVAGLFSGWKALAGQLKAGFGDIAILERIDLHDIVPPDVATAALSKRWTIVKRAEVLAGDFAGQAQLQRLPEIMRTSPRTWANLRFWGRVIGVDVPSNLIVPMSLILARPWERWADAKK